MAKQHPTVIAIGKNKGHPTTKLVANKKTVRQSRTKGRLGKRVGFIRQLVGEVSGVSGY
jgi:large subunit ribosomal protein L36e